MCAQYLHSTGKVWVIITKKYSVENGISTSDILQSNIVNHHGNEVCNVITVDGTSKEFWCLIKFLVKSNF